MHRIGRPRLVSGSRLTFIRIGVALSILRIAFLFNKNPLKSISLLRSLIRERKNIHENSGEIKAVKTGSRYYWSVNVPGWPSEAFDHFIRNEFLRLVSPEKSKLQTIIFSITNICHLDCKHCYEAENLAAENSLSMAELKIVMNKIHAHGIRHVHLSGGEPLNRFEEMNQLMKYTGNNHDFWINTSGFGLSKDKASLMKKNGMTGAIISLDDWDEIRHNAFRGNDKAYYWVREATRNCVEAGIMVCLSLCPVKEFISKNNLDRYFELAMDWGASFIRIMEPRKIGRFAGKDITLGIEEIDLIDKFMVTRNHGSLYKKHPIILFPGHHQRKSGCLGAGNRYLFIDAKGNYHACPFCRKPLGNAVTDSVEEGISRARQTGCHAFVQNSLI
jgi:molybdenum cofactor biosynthesis enzyme MoaA